MHSLHMLHKGGVVDINDSLTDNTDTLAEH